MAATPEPLSPVVLDGLIHDTSALRGSASPLAAALERHHALRGGDHADVVSGLAVPASAVDELRTLVDPDGHVAVSLVADGGLLKLQEARHAIQDDTWIELTHVEIDLPTGFSSGESAAALLEELAFTVPTYVGLPRTGYETALDVLARDGAERAGYSCGGEEGVPTAGELAAFVHGAVDRRVPFRVSGGITQALATPGDDAAHGALNVIAAAAGARNGLSTDALVELLGSGDAAHLLAVVASVPPRELRGSLRGIGTHDVAGLLAQLAEAGAL